MPSLFWWRRGTSFKAYADGGQSGGGLNSGNSNTGRKIIIKS
jgi:hypothetical protein